MFSVNRGKCPICGVYSCTCKGASGGVGVVILPAQKPGEALIDIQLKPGVHTRMTVAQATALGYIAPVSEPDEKMRPQARNKLRRKAQNKSREVSE